MLYLIYIHAPPRLPFLIYVLILLGPVGLFYLLNFTLTKTSIIPDHFHYKMRDGMVSDFFS